MKPIQVKSTVAQHTADKQRVSERDPNRLYWPKARFGDETQFPYSEELPDNKGVSTRKFLFRPLPVHDTNNPNGYIQLIRFKLFLGKLGRPEFVISPSSQGPDFSCPYQEVIKAVDEEFMKQGAFAEFWDNIDMGQLKLKATDKGYDEEAYQDAVFKRDYLEFCKPWITFLIPGLLWARCDEKPKVGTPYTDLVNYRPDMKNILTRTLELNNVKMVYQLIGRMQPSEEQELTDDEREAIESGMMPAPVQVNNAENGMPVMLRRSKVGKGDRAKVSYELEVPQGMRPSPLPKEIADKLAADPKNYPNPLEFDVRKKLKTEDEMLNLLYNSSIAEPLIRFGIIGKAKDIDANDSAASNEEPF